MSLTEFKPGIHYVGVNDRRTTLFEGLWSLPYSVSYNSYLVVGDKIALIDTVEEGFTSLLIQNIRHAIGDRKIDYLIVNHMEPDHSSSMTFLRQIYPDMQIVGNAKTLQMIQGYYGLTEGTIEVKEGESIDLGGGKTLSFYLIPMVHWPETMVTWYKEEQTLFTGDAFGTFGALNGGITDATQKYEDFKEEMRRYYACIVGKYGAPVQKALAKVATLNPKTICATHGPIWEKSVKEVIAQYDQMSRYEGENGVVLVYGSMYGNTEQMAEQIARNLSEEGVEKIVMYNLNTADMSLVLRDLFRYNSLIVGSPTYNGMLYPPVAQLLDQIVLRAIPHRHFAAFGSFTWANATKRCLTEFATKMKWEPVCAIPEMKQGFSLEQCENSAKEIAHSIAEKLRA